MLTYRYHDGRWPVPPVTAALRWAARHGRVLDERILFQSTVRTPALALTRHTLSRGLWPAGNNIVREHYM